MKKKNKTQELKEKAAIFALCLIALVILLLGCHYEATYVTKCKVISKTEATLEVENLNNHVNYECETTGTETIHIGEKIYCKFTNEATESNPYDDHFIKYGNNCFWCFVWGK